MDLTNVQYFLLITGLGLAVFTFGFAYIAPSKISVPFLILMIPFQIVDSRYGTANVGMAYLFFLALMLRGQIKHVPLLLPMGVILFAYFISLSQTHPSTLLDHGPYMVLLLSNFLLFFIVYNWASSRESSQEAVRVFLVLNILVVVYGFIQLFAGFDRLGISGISQFGIMVNREDSRLMGPFYAVGITAEYLVLTTYLVLYDYVMGGKALPRAWSAPLLAANFGFLVATGNRGGLLVLIASLPIFIWMFRREIGIKGIGWIAAVGIPMFLIMATLVTKYTDFNVLFDRLSETKVTEGVPDTRKAVWPQAWEAIQNKPLYGHGPRLRFYDEWNRNVPGREPIGFPHNGYLYILYTVGVIGLVGYLFFFLSVAFALHRSAFAPSSTEGTYLSGIRKLGLLFLLVFAVDQIKIEFLRFNLSDYQHFVFALMGLLMAIVTKARKESMATRRHREGRNTGSSQLLVDQAL